tara:strand:+ start:1006 stop:2205 length:1200 start_codon:yes stop_codon:yes gene_type:complete
MSNFSLTCTNQRKQRSQFFFFEGGAKSRFTPTCPYVKDSSGNLLYTPRDLDMRRKAEILKYVKPNNGNASKNKYAQLATATKKNRNKVICPTDYTPKPTSSSNVPGKIINLYEDPNVPLYNYFPLTEQFKFQNIKYDNFKRLFDIFSNQNVIGGNGLYETLTTIIILNPNSNQFSFDFTIPISLNYSAIYNNTTYVTQEGEFQAVESPSNDIVSVPAGIDYKITNANLSVISATMEIKYSDSIIQTIEASYVSDPAQSSDLRSALVTQSIELNNSSDGEVESTIYLGNLNFNNVILQTVSQYVYTINIKVNIGYAEYSDIQSTNSVLPYRTNNNGNNVNNSNAKNLQDVVYSVILNIENSQIYTNDKKNCVSITFNNDTAEIVTPVYRPFNITSTEVRT